MNPTFATYELFHEKESSRELIRILKKHHIDYRFEDDSPTFDPSFVNQDFQKDFRVKIQPKDFQQVDELMVRIAESQFEQVTPDYFLFGFTNKELMNVIGKRDEWGHFNFAFAQKLLRDREFLFPRTSCLGFIKIALKSSPNQKMSPEPGYSPVIYLLYLEALLALFIGWHLMTFKKTLPNGSRSMVFHPKTGARKIYCGHQRGVLILVILKRIFTGEASRF
jgi:hypothetical protein